MRKRNMGRVAPAEGSQMMSISISLYRSELSEHLYASVSRSVLCRADV